MPPKQTKQAVYKAKQSNAFPADSESKTE